MRNPPAVAEAMLQTARQRIKTAGHPLVIDIAPLGGGKFRCTLCCKDADDERSFMGYSGALICDACILFAANDLSGVSRTKRFKHACEAIAWHFAGLAHDEVVTTSRQFPGHMRADVQVALDKLFSASPAARFFGLHEQYRYETLTYATLTQDGQHAVTIAAAQFEIAVPAGEEGAAFVQRCFTELERSINIARSYRGKVLSLDTEAEYRGRSKGVMVHRLPPVARDEVVLPEATLKLLDRNVLRFIESRDALRRLRQSTRKGILLYGPPGTGKTHTIRYLAANLPGHTTLLITADQMGLLSHYMTLARLLQPAMVVIEDVDLIARDRNDMGSACEESLLNTLLNEMDGLKDNADILFVLTTNRPEQLEGALAGRPGRIDQAIEVPLPDDIGRAKLVRLYSGGLKLSDALVGEAVARTKGVSAAFIKELMRRTAQSGIMRGDGEAVTSGDLAEALDDMLFTGGRLNVKLLGAAPDRAAAE
jgi:hypothetical protein